EAEALLTQAKEKLPRTQLPLTLAHCYVILGNAKAAEENFLVALGNHPTDKRLRMDVAGFYLRTGQAEKAEPTLKDFLEAWDASPEQKAWARRNLAVVWVARNDYRLFQKALALLEENRKDNPNEPAD